MTNATFEAQASLAKKPVIAVFAGTFDPITLGHEEMIQRATCLFDQVVVAVAMAHHKKTMFSLEERLALVQQCFSTSAAVKVLPFDGLLVDFAQKVGATAMVRGVRGSVDFDYESQLAGMNRHMRPGIDTVLLMPQPETQAISSTLVREIAKLAGPFQQFVSPPVVQAMLEKIKIT